VAVPDIVVWLAMLAVAVVVALPGLVRGAPARLRATQPTVPAHARRASGRPVRWWAELAGAITLVGFAGAALGLSMVTGHERDVRAEADRQSIAAERLLEEGEQAALRDLSTVGELAELDARSAAANQAELAQTDEAERIDASRSVAATHAGEIEVATRDDLGRLAVDPRNRAMCPIERTGDGRDADALLADVQTDSSAFSAHIAAEAEAGTACSVLAAASRSTAAQCRPGTAPPVCPVRPRRPRAARGGDTVEP
jgi:hypothetical protein